MSSVGVQDRAAATIDAVLSELRRESSARYSRTRFERLLTLAEMAGDLLAGVLSVVSAYAIYHALQVGKQLQYDWRFVNLTAFGFGLFFVLLLDRDGAYRKGCSLLRIKETERILRVTAKAYLVAFSITFFTGTLVSRWGVLIGCFLAPFFLILEKQLLLSVVRALHERGYGVKKVVIYGAGYTGRRALSALMRSPKAGLSPLALIDDNPKLAGVAVYESDYHRRRSVQVLAGPVTRELLHEQGAEMLVLAIPSLSHERFLQTLRECAAAGAEFVFVPGQAVGSEFLVDYTEIDGLFLNSFVQPAPRRLYESLKRIFDFAAGAFLLFCALPALLVAAISVRLDSAGPILFRQDRVGRDGKLFTMYKFRTMYKHMSGYALSPKEARDPRITRVGRFLRRTSLDELPQLFNVLKGEMSLVGPRPEMPFIVAQYSGRERQRLDVLPGITGLWQLSADRAFLIHENIQYDLYYIKNRSFFMDLAILLHTVVFAMHGV